MTKLPRCPICDTPAEMIHIGKSDEEDYKCVEIRCPGHCFAVYDESEFEARESWSRKCKEINATGLYVVANKEER